MRLDDLLFVADQADGDVALVHVGSVTYTRADVRARAVALAANLDSLGFGPGDAVGVMLPNDVAVVAALFGVWRAGCVYVPLNPRLTDHEIVPILDAVDLAAVITTDEHAARFPGHPLVITTPITPFWQVKPTPGRGFHLPERAERERGERPGAPPGREGGDRFGSDVGLIQFTSGTTGRPKPVLLLHSGVLTLLDGVIAKLRARDQADGADPPATPPAPMPNLIPVSLSLWAGIYNVLFALRVGAPVVLMDAFDPHLFTQLVERFGIRSTVLPPAAMTALADDPTITDLGPLRFVRSITAPLSPLQARRFKDRFGIAVLNSYGQTEIGGEIVGWTAADSRAFGDTKLGSVGRPHRDVELRIVDDHQSVVSPGVSGELQVRTPALSAGYADGNDLSDRLTDDGWFRTGDLGRLDDEGFLWIDGRASDMINRGGLKVHPADVDEVLRLDAGVADVAVVGVPDERLGQVPWAFVVPASAADVDPSALDAHCRAHLAPYKVPVRFVAVDSLPRNEVGKVLVRDLVARAEASR